MRMMTDVDSSAQRMAPYWLRRSYQDAPGNQGKCRMGHNSMLPHASWLLPSCDLVVLHLAVSGVG